MKIKKIAIIALFTAISSVLMYFDFPLPIAPSFMKMDLSELPVIIGAFLLGPIDCIIIAVLKILIKLSLKGTSTFFVGELANLIGSISYALPSSIIYAKLKTKKRAIVGLTIGTILASIICTLSNAIFIFPIYMNALNWTNEKIIAMCKALIPFIDSMSKVYLYSILPFNLIKFAITSIITYIFYKKISYFVKSILK